MRLIDFFDRAASQYSGKAFLRQGDVTRSYADARDASHRIAAGLRRDGIAPGEPVGFYMSNDWRGVEALYGTFRAGNPISPANSRNGVAANIDYLNTTCATALFFHSNYADDAMAVAKSCPSVRLMVCLDQTVGDYPSLADWMAPAGTISPDMPVEPTGPWGLFGTSGTTGNSKCVVQTHLTALALTWDMLFAMRAHEPSRHLVVAPLSHFAGTFLFALTAVGSTHFIHEKVDVLEIMRTIERERIEYLFLPPTVIYMMLAHPEVRNFDYSSLKAFTYAGAPMAKAKVIEAIEVFGPVMMNMLGQTECNGPITFLRPEEHRINAGPEWDWRLQSIGRASVNRQIAIMGDDGSILPPGQAGELVIRGWGNSAGYLNNPEATAELFRDGWLHTGDVGIMDDEGYVVLMDRKKDMIISGGLNVFSVEVEEVLLSHPAVLAAAVIGIPHEKWGEAVHAVVELKDGVDVSADELIQLCKGQLGGVKAPKSVEFRPALPRNPTGKILKREIRKDFWRDHDRAI